MNDINSLIVTGRVTKDVEVKQSNSGTVMYNFSIAINTGFGDNKKVTFLNCTIFDKKGTLGWLGTTIVKGVFFSGSGSLNMRKYEDKYYTSMNVFSYNFVQTVPYNANQNTVVTQAVAPPQGVAGQMGQQQGQPIPPQGVQKGIAIPPNTIPQEQQPQVVERVFNSEPIF